MRPIAAFAHYSVNGDISGVTTWFSRFVLWLHARGVRLVVLLHHFGDDPQRSELYRTLFMAGVEVEAHLRPAFTEDAVSDTLEFLRRHRPHIFIPSCMEAFFYAARAAGDQGLPWIFCMHSDDPVYWAAIEVCEPEQHNGAVVVVSQHIAALAKQSALARDVAVFPYGVANRTRRAVFNSHPFRVLYSGRVIEEQKRISLVLETLAAACRDTAIEARVLGDGPALAYARSWVERRGLNDRIRFTGRLSAAEVENQLADAQCILLMSDYEGLPVALLEAMAAGVVPVARHIPSGIPEVVRDGLTGLLVQADAVAAAAAIHRLAGDRALWERCSAGALRLVLDRYTEEHAHERWYTLLLELALQSDGPQIHVPRKLALPREHPALSGRDVRRGHWQTRALRGMRRVVARGLHLVRS